MIPFSVKRITVYANVLPNTPLDFVNFLETINKLANLHIPEEHKYAAKIGFADISKSDYEDPAIEMRIYYDRLETPEETTEREASLFERVKRRIVLDEKDGGPIVIQWNEPV